MTGRPSPQMIFTRLLLRSLKVAGSIVRGRDASEPEFDREMADGLRLLAQIGVEPATIVDVGASDGRWSELARAVFPAAELFLFEPQPVHAAALERFQAA